MAIGIDLSIGSSAASGGGGGSLPSGFLQVAGGVPLSTTLRTITDGDGNASPLNLATGSIRFGGTTGLFWDNANNRLGVGTSSPSNLLHISGASRLSNVYIGLAGNNAISNSGGDTTININNGVGIAGGSIITPTARLHVRGDGTNPIARFENGAGAGRISIADVGTLTTTVASGQANFTFGYVGNATSFNMNTNGVITHYSTSAGSGIETFRVIADGVASHTSGNMRILQVSGAGFSPASGTGAYRPFEINYTLNASGANTGTATGIFLNATETALNGMEHNLIDLQVGGSSRFVVSRLGVATAEGLISNGNIRNSSGGSYQWLSRSRMNSPADGVITISNNSSNDFNRLQLGGTTNAFPAIKRNGAAIDFRLADDSSWANFNCGSVIVNHPSVATRVLRLGWGAVYAEDSGSELALGADFSIPSSPTISLNGSTRSIAANAMQLQAINGFSFAAAFAVPNQSAIVDIESTTKGFLPPRMTTAEVNAIATPAEGLVVYSTTENQLCLYNGTAWRKLNDSPL
jgi:hypothetical protein